MSTVLERADSRVYRDYSEEDKASIIARYQANDCNLKRTAEEVGINPATLRYWVHSGIQFQPRKAMELSDKLDAIANQCADLLPGMLPEASVREVVGAMGQSIQLSQLLKGLPTSITETIEAQEITVILAQAIDEAIDITPE